MNVQIADGGACLGNSSVSVRKLLSCASENSQPPHHRRRKRAGEEGLPQCDDIIRVLQDRA